MSHPNSIVYEEFVLWQIVKDPFFSYSIISRLFFLSYDELWMLCAFVSLSSLSLVLMPVYRILMLGFRYLMVVYHFWNN